MRRSLSVLVCLAIPVLGWTQVAPAADPAADRREIDLVSDTQQPLGIEKVKLHANRNTEATALIFSHMVGRRPAAIYMLGDVTAASSSNSKWRLVDRFLDSCRHYGIPVHALLGNHDVLWSTRMGERNFQKRFADEVHTGFVSITDSIAFVMLNSNFKRLSRTALTAELNWYKAMLGKLDKDAGVKAIIVCCHHAPYSNSLIVGCSRPVQANFVPAFLKTPKCRLFITGHSHNFEQFKISGKDFFVIGGGGGLHQPLDTSARCLPDLAHAFKPAFHYLALRREADTILVILRSVKADFSGIEEAYRYKIAIFPMEGPYQPTDQSFRTYKYPDWFRDAKFGIWAHWGPQAVPRHGDWYARLLYQEGSDDYKDHLARYGHPSRLGYKDIIPLWTAQKWNPEKLMALYKRTGARYFVSMGSHHDNFFLWNSHIHRWNAVNMGPHKDVVGIWQAAAKKEGLYFGVSEHLAASYTWFQMAHKADTAGPYKGIPYDGNDPQYADLYHTKAAPGDNGWLTTNPDWMKEWYLDVKELVDNYHPDLLYSDSKLPFDEIGRDMLANFYNGNWAFHHGEPTAVYTCKEPSQGRWAQDLERGVQDTISPFPWQTDTSIGDWFYREGQKYKTSTEIIQMLVDIVSKNGNLLINVVQTPEGDLEPDILHILDGIGVWMATNGEGIYGTRPWSVYGEHPANASVVKTGNFNEGRLKYTAEDIRFTIKGDNLYAFCLDLPVDGKLVIKSLGKTSPLNARTITEISLMGGTAPLTWIQKDDALVITLPTQLPDWKILGFKIGLK